MLRIIRSLYKPGASYLQFANPTIIRLFNSYKHNTCGIRRRNLYHGWRPASALSQGWARKPKVIILLGKLLIWFYLSNESKLGIVPTQTRKPLCLMKSRRLLKDHSGSLEMASLVCRSAIHWLESTWVAHLLELCRWIPRIKLNQNLRKVQSKSKIQITVDVTISSWGRTIKYTQSYTNLVVSEIYFASSQRPILFNSCGYQDQKGEELSKANWCKGATWLIT